MARGKKRLYVAIYPSGVVGNEERKYHWGFLVGPKEETMPEVPGTRYHVKNNPLRGWVFEEVNLENVKNTTSLLARILVGKVEDEKRLVQILRETPIIQNDPNWRCRSWLASALELIAADGTAIGSARLEWTIIEAKGRQYVAEKTAEGRYATQADLAKPKPTWDLIQQREIVP